MLSAPYSGPRLSLPMLLAVIVLAAGIGGSDGLYLGCQHVEMGR